MGADPVDATGHRSSAFWWSANTPQGGSVRPAALTNQIAS